MKRNERGSKNPLFEAWLMEWRDEAKGEDNPMQFSLSKALKSLQQCPLRLETGKDCYILQHFGKKICTMIDKKLKEHNNILGLPQAENIARTANMAKSKRKLSPDRAESAKGKKNKPAAPYVPTVRSGAYAILLTMYNNSKEADYKGFMTKVELQREAQPLCDISFQTQIARSYYSAWSGMSTLIEKGLVTKKGSPAKYKLTDHGVAMAMQLEEATDENSPLFSLHQPSHSTDHTVPSSTSYDHFNDSSVPRHSTDKLPLSDSSKYTDTAKRRVPSATITSSNYDKADTLSLPEKTASTEPVSFDFSQYINLDVENELSATPESSELTDYELALKLQFAEETNIRSPPPFASNNFTDVSPVSQISQRIDARSPLATNLTIAEGDNLLMQNALHSTSRLLDNEIDLILKDTGLKTDTTSSSQYNRPEVSEQLDSDSDDCVIVEEVAEKVEQRKDQAFEKLLYRGINDIDTVNRISNNKTNTKETDSDLLTHSTESAFTFAPHTFDVLLLVDTQETAGGRAKKNIRDKAQENNCPTIRELTQIKVPFEVRQLKVGDFAWVAKSRYDNRELVLPYIVERKRMDDLSGSIRDGRYHGQKFRLKRCGIPNVIYLIESFGNNQYTAGIPLTSLYQASINTLVHDNFMVKFTDNHFQSMKYLATLTGMISEIFEKKYLIQSRKQDLQTIDPLNHSVRLMDYKEFNKSSSKVKNYSVEKMFIRQLIQLKGMSIDKASAIVERYPTPLMLKKALDNAAPNGEQLLSNIKVGALQRQLGPAIAKTIHRFYTQRLQ